MSAFFMSRVAQSRFERRSTVIANKSPFSGKVFRSGFPDEQWVFSFETAWMTHTEGLPIRALIAAQKSGIGQMAVFDPDFAKPLPGSRAALQNGTVNGAAQTDDTLNVDFDGAVSSLVARAGERLWIEYPGPVYRMFELLEDCVTSGAGGTATMLLDRPLRIAPANGAAIGFDFITSFRGIPARVVESGQDTDLAGNIRFRISGEEII